jgi:hypothetical protein
MTTALRRCSEKVRRVFRNDRVRHPGSNPRSLYRMGYIDRGKCVVRRDLERNWKMPLDVARWFAVSCRGLRLATPDHDRYPPQHAARPDWRRSHRARQDCITGSHPVDRINLGRSATTRNVLPARLAPGRRGQCCLARTGGRLGRRWSPRRRRCCHASWGAGH